LAVGREFRLRVRETFEAHDIEIGVPKQAIEIRNAEHDGEQVYA